MVTKFVTISSKKIIHTAFTSGDVNRGEGIGLLDGMVKGQQRGSAHLLYAAQSGRIMATCIPTLGVGEVTRVATPRLSETVVDAIGK